jgi:uracil phosphoribosyltransferase
MSVTPQPTSPKVHISTHPLVLSKLTQLRLHDLPNKEFREGIKAIGWVHIMAHICHKSSHFPKMLFKRSWCMVMSRC